MEKYKQNDISLGSSDYSTLIVVACTDVIKTCYNHKSDFIHQMHMGGDGDYKAHVVTDIADVPSHYQEFLSTKSWLKIYDDTRLVYSGDGPHTIYRAGDYGILILKGGL